VVTSVRRESRSAIPGQPSKPGRRWSGRRRRSGHSLNRGYLESRSQARSETSNPGIHSTLVEIRAEPSRSRRSSRCSRRKHRAMDPHRLQAAGARSMPFRTRTFRRSPPALPKRSEGTKTPRMRAALQRTRSAIPSELENDAESLRVPLLRVGGRSYQCCQRLPQEDEACGDAVLVGPEKRSYGDRFGD
jgi:hypothetical protein